MLNLVIFGPPGSGKGTQAAHIKEKYGLKHLSTGEMLRHEVALKTPLGLEVGKLINNGQLVSDELITEVLRNAVKEKIETVPGFIFDGFPRTGNQAESLEEVLKSFDEKVDIVISLKVSDDELIKRILLRGETSGRADDNETIIKERLEIYRQNVNDIMGFYQKNGKLHEVDGEGSPQEVFIRITELINRHL